MIGYDTIVSWTNVCRIDNCHNYSLQPVLILLVESLCYIIIPCGRLYLGGRRYSCCRGTMKTKSTPSLIYLQGVPKKNETPCSLNI